VRDFDPQALA
jgi:hypothetical protein